ncbi:AfsR/SARP family transcriptional regulator [Paractinoplanes ferrugineus]|uniref:AfsR/SARP family transcriptional regulator n=1 Tax=Paractinoplanes ferrugineus TaxID=113564 RepID=UPI001944A613|nr:AfsR/SARP family transcriptional regulator [Actinoplanes ferrugineus]
MGPLEVIDRTVDLTPTAPKVRQVLSLLLLRNNQPVHANELIDELWGERAPRSALSTLQTYIYKLRKVLNSDGRDGRSETLHTKPYGYVLSIPRESLDLHVFERLVAEAATALEADNPEVAAERLERAFGLWRGRALSDIVAGESLSAHLTRLEENRLRAVELSCDTKLRLGRHNELISELKTLTAENPLHESFHTRLMITLYRAGRRTEALEVYSRLRQVLCDDLGLDPSPMVGRTYQALLSADPSLDEDAPVAAAGASAAIRALGSPAQLPADVGDFVGREDLLEQAEQWLADAPHQTAMPVLVVTGMAGIGKTAFATRLAHRLANAYPDGHLYHQLRGPDGTPIDSATVLTKLLRTAGVPASELPDELEDLQKIFRTWSSGRSMLLLLDDAVSARQVAPLLPGYARCAVIVTSTERLHSLAGACTVDLPPLDARAGAQLLSSIIGEQRFTAHREESAALIRLCAGVPAVLRSVGASITARNWSTAARLGQLTAGGLRLDHLSFGDENLRRRIETHCQDLSMEQWLVLAAFGRLDSATVTPAEVAACTGMDVEDAELSMLSLVDRNLATVISGCARPLYAMHELLRLYAGEVADRLLETPVDNRRPPAKPQLAARWQDARMGQRAQLTA